MKEAKYPIYEIIDGKKKIIWRNLFRIKTSSILLIIFIIALTLLYRFDTAKCRDLITNPCDYIEQFNCFNQSYPTYGIEPVDIFEFNLTHNATEK